ncbi:MAG: hypothetical protein ABIE70_05185 [bacterium]
MRRLLPQRGSRNLKWFYMLAIVLGLAAIVAVVFLVVRSGWIVERLNRDSDGNGEPEKVECDT